MITHELLKRPLTAQEATELAEHLTTKVKTAFVLKPGYFYLDQDDTVYLDVDGDYGPNTLWCVAEEAMYASQIYWEAGHGREFRPLCTQGGNHLNIGLAS